MAMNRQELDAEINAIRDLNQRLSDRIEQLTRRLHRHFNPVSDGSHPIRPIDAPPPERWPPRTRDDEDDGSD